MGELANIVGSTTPVQLKDRNGVEHGLSVPTLGDMAEIEREFGTFAAIAEPSMEVLQFLLYLSLRREGKTSDQLAAGDFAITLYEVGEIFTVKQLLEVQKALSDLLVEAGLREPDTEEESDPTNASPAEEALDEGLQKEPGDEQPSSVPSTQESDLASSES